MVFKAGMVVMALGGDPEKHRSTIKTQKFEFTTVLVELMNVDQVVNVSKDLVQNQGVHSLILCPGCTHEIVGKVVEAVGDKVAVTVARGDVPSVLITAETLKKEGWFPEGH